MGMGKGAQLYIFVNNSDQVACSERGTRNDARPDGYFVRPTTSVASSSRTRSQPEASRHSWDDIALPCEFQQ